MPPFIPLEEKLLGKLDRESTECWLYTGYCTYDGYGNIGSLGKNYRAHRVAHELWIGPIPEDYEVDHLCNVRNCCNPAHLEAVTRTVNLRRIKRATHCPLGHPYEGDNLFVAKDGRRKCRICQADSCRRWRERSGYTRHDPTYRKPID